MSDECEIFNGISTWKHEWVCERRHPSQQMTACQHGCFQPWFSTPTPPSPISPRLVGIAHQPNKILTFTFAVGTIDTQVFVDSQHIFRLFVINGPYNKKPIHNALLGHKVTLARSCHDLSHNKHSSSTTDMCSEYECAYFSTKYADALLEQAFTWHWLEPPPSTRT